MATVTEMATIAAGENWHGGASGNVVMETLKIRGMQAFQDSRILSYRIVSLICSRIVTAAEFPPPLLPETGFCASISSLHI